MEHEPADGFNDGFVQLMYENYLSNPESVSHEWRESFAQHEPVYGTPPAREATDAPNADNGTDGTAAAAPVPVTGAGAPTGPKAVTPAGTGEPPANAKLLRGPAAAVVRNMNESRSMPVATTLRTVAVAELDARRQDLNAQLAAQGRKLNFTHVIAWALVQAWRELPVIGHTFAEVAGKPYRVANEHVNFGLAVDVERPDGTRGLVVPVIRQADQLDARSFFDRYDKLVATARAGKLALDDMLDTTLTLTNPGGLGTTASVPRLMAGQGTIVATGSIAYPVEFAHLTPEQLTELGVSKVMTLTSTYDHRVIQGAESGAFLRIVDQLLQGERDFYTSMLDGLGLGKHEGTIMLEPGASLLEVHHDMLDEPPAYPRVETRPVSTSTEQLASVAAAMALVKAHRTHGHLAADLDPLKLAPTGDPSIEPATLGLNDEIMRTIPASVLRIGVEGETLADALPRLREKYCGTIAYEIEHISDHDQRVWLRRMVEAGEHRRALRKNERTQLLDRLTDVEVFERFVRRAYLAQKQFSIEGLEMMVPMLDEVIVLSASHGAYEVVLGMAHRGRLNVLTHIVGRPYEAIMREFEAEGRVIAGTALPSGGTGDVKYHQGASGNYETEHGTIEVSLAPNPSHLEAVNPIVVGRTRAEQTLRKGRETFHDPTAAVAVLIHGDAAFPGQGIVAETLNLQALDGYSTGGTVHIIANNQLGFTTTPTEGRSTRYASDLAKGFDAPIIHVNADDPESCLAAVRLAMAFRHRFQRDSVIDLIGYRRHGHNEGDEPAYTQPRMYEKIKAHPRVRERFARRLVEQQLTTEAAVTAMYDERYKSMAAVHEHVLQIGEREPVELNEPTGDLIERVKAEEPDTTLSEASVRHIVEQLLHVPEDFTVHPKLVRQLERRRKMPDEKFDWGTAEALALASLLEQGTSVRLTGQDTARGTFAHRHAMLHDVNTGERYIPLQNLPDAGGAFELYNSPLSEAGCLGFEYGYSIAAPESLVIWEAQFGDFVNGAQVVIDQFISSGMAKWNATTRLTLLLPHGYEGNGPEHSNARLSRFLAMAAEGNIRVANCTTAGQYFHLLRRQGMIAKQRPLVVMTPKGLLRAPYAMSPISEITSKRFEYVIDDPRLTDDELRSNVARLVLCSGKVYHDIASYTERHLATGVAVARIELLYPFPRKQVSELVARYPNLSEVVWVQEEPLNFGAYSFMLQRVPQMLPDGVAWGFAGRPKRSSTSEGYTSVHLIEQERIVREALRLPER